MSFAEALRIIVITDEILARPRPVTEVVREALEGGARAIQLRNKEASGRELLDQARALRSMTRGYGALLFINDRFDVALAAGADGVHVGPNDIPVAAVRRAAPSGFLIGSSTDQPKRAVQLQSEGADYIGCGTVFPTTTKKDAGGAIGISGLRRVVDAVRIPVVGIGGITAQTAGRVVEGSGASGVAVVSAVMAAKDVKKAVGEILTPKERDAGSALHGSETSSPR